MQVLLTIVAVVIWFIAAWIWKPYSLVSLVRSSLLGGLAVFLPALLCAYLLRHLSGSVIALLVNETIKVLFTLALLALFVSLYAPIHWLPLLTSYLLVLKSYWLALLNNEVL